MASVNAEQLKQLSSHPTQEKLHFYVCNAFRTMRLGRIFSHLLMLLVEKKLHPVFNKFALLPGDLTAISNETLQIRSVQAFERMPPEALDVLYEQSTYTTFSWLKECLRTGSTLWLGYFNGIPVAYCCTKWFGVDPERQRDSYLFAVETLGTFRGRSLGTSFVRGVCASLFNQGVPQVWSETHIWNLPSNRMHQRLGFKLREIKSVFER